MPKKGTPANGAYEGILAAPIIRPTITPFSDKDASDLYIQIKYEEKIKALYEHYDLKINAPNAQQALIMRMALDHVPGFQLRTLMPPSVGSPAKWKTSAGVKLYVDVKKRINTGQSVLTACKELCLEKAYKGCTPSSLKTRFHEVRRNVEEHNPKLEVLANLLPDYFPESIWTTSAPDGTALFQNPSIVQGFIDMLSHPHIQK